MQSLATYYSLYSTPTSGTHASGFASGILVISLIVAIISVVSMWIIFQKAGRPGWAAIIPIYNLWVLFEISGKPGWWALVVVLYVIPVIQILAGILLLVFYILAMLELAKRFGKSTVFAIFGLVIFSFVGLPILAFGPSKYKKIAVTPKVD